MPRSIWKGAIAFGLVYVPVALYPASQEDDVDFDWLDKRSMDPVGYQRINKRTGKTITKENIVKGVKQDDGSYVVVDDDEIRAAYPKTTQTIEIDRFIRAGDLPYVYLEKPYFLEPAQKADKVYALLRDAMTAAGVIGIARIVMHNKEHLAALMPAGPALMLNTLRWASEIRSPEALALPSTGKAAARPKEGELELARKLIDQLTGAWKPEQFHDRFVEEIHKLVAAKAAAGKTFEVTPMEHVEEGERPSNVVDLAELLRNSLGAAHGARSAAKSESRSAKTRASPAAERSTGSPAARERPTGSPAARKRPARATASHDTPPRTSTTHKRTGATHAAATKTAGAATPARKRA